MDDLVLHEQNTGFVWTDHRGPFRLVTAEQAESFDRDGYFLLEGALDPKVLALIEAELDPLEAANAERLRELGGKETISSADEITFTANLVARSMVLRRFVSSPPLTDLVADLVGSDVRVYWDQAVYKKPEMDKDFPWHQDNGYRFVEPQAYLTCWMPLVDATVSNGCPWVWPGVHRKGTLAHVPSDLGLVCKHGDEGAVAVEAKVGDVVVFSSLTPHRTGPNRTQSVRKAYITLFAPDGARWDDRPCDNPAWQFSVLVDGRTVPS